MHLAPLMTTFNRGTTGSTRPVPGANPVNPTGTGEEFSWSSVKGVYKNCRGIWAAQWTDEKGQRHTKYFNPKFYASEATAKFEAYKFKVHIQREIELKGGVQKRRNPAGNRKKGRRDLTLDCSTDDVGRRIRRGGFIGPPMMPMYGNPFQPFTHGFAQPYGHMFHRPGSPDFVALLQAMSPSGLRSEDACAPWPRPWQPEFYIPSAGEVPDVNSQPEKSSLEHMFVNAWNTSVPTEKGPGDDPNLMQGMSAHGHPMTQMPDGRPPGGDVSTGDDSTSTTAVATPTMEALGCSPHETGGMIYPGAGWPYDPAWTAARHLYISYPMGGGRCDEMLNTDRDDLYIQDPTPDTVDQTPPLEGGNCHPSLDHGPGD